MGASNSCRQEMLIEQSKYHILVDNELRSLKFNTSMHSKFAGLIFFNIILASFFCWASAGSESNIYTFPQNGVLICIIVYLILGIWPVTVVISAWNRKKTLGKEMLTCQTEIINLLVPFIKAKIQRESSIDFADFNSKHKYFENPDCSLIFMQSEFETYIEKNLSVYSKHTSFVFYSNYAYFSLLSLCLWEIIDRVSCGVDAKYSITFRKSPLVVAKILT